VKDAGGIVRGYECIEDAKGVKNGDHNFVIGAVHEHFPDVL